MGLLGSAGVTLPMGLRHILTYNKMTYEHTLEEFDKIIVAFSGGKDSTACFLNLLDRGVPKEKIELWHHLVDGPDIELFSSDVKMDWKVTEDYCRKFAKAFDVPIYYSWRQGGFHREMYRHNMATGKIIFETPDGIKTAGGLGSPGTRMKFPQISANLSTRWCSAYLKIDVCASAIRNQPRFNELKTLVVSGERGEESKARANYAIVEYDRAHAKKRHVERYRPIRDWKEEQVWGIIEKHKVVAHPSYYAGFSRCSCLFCIFGNADQFASAAVINPTMAQRLIQAEEEFEYTMKRNISLLDLIEKGIPYNDSLSYVDSKEYHGKIFAEEWQLPSGAYGEGCGPI